MIASLLVFCAALAGAASTAPANELSAILEIRAINTAEVNYYTGHDRYATKLEDLGDEVKPVHNGYRFTLAGTASGYTIHADPLKYPDTGRRSFFSDETTVIRQNKGDGPATAASPEVE
ncbi:MAG TPA: hypothetical protein VMJ34_24080 [Bryobacteraceae bacterium]|nr:hypothetical protein [Bryobacteraceae bacterium]